MEIKVGLISSAYSQPTPPLAYGGVERINYWIGQELVKAGFDVTLFGAKGSYLQGATVVELPGGGEIRPSEGGDYPPFTEFMSHYVDSSTIFHDSSLHHEFARVNEDKVHTLCTIHNPNQPEARKNNVCISNFHAVELGVDDFVYNGVPEDEMSYSKIKDSYVLYLGAIGEHKGCDILLKEIVPQMPDVHFIFAGHPTNGHMQGLLGQAEQLGNFEYYGIADSEQRKLLLAFASAALFYVQWPEPGSVAVIEAMASGTPVIGSARGVLPEYVRPETGYICGDSEAVVLSIRNCLEGRIKPEDCYARYKANFTASRMAHDYIARYERILKG